jgi:hypothetical protein
MIVNVRTKIELRSRFCCDNRFTSIFLKEKFKTLVRQKTKCSSDSKKVIAKSVLRVKGSEDHKIYAYMHTNREDLLAVFSPMNNVLASVRFVKDKLMHFALHSSIN